MSYERRRSADLTTRAVPHFIQALKMGRRAACKCGRCADCIKRAAIKKDKAATRKVKSRAAKKAAGDSTEQEKDTKARQLKRAALRAAGVRIGGAGEEGGEAQHEQGGWREPARALGSRRR